MSNLELYKPLIQIIYAIKELHTEFEGNPERKRKAEIKKELPNLNQALDEKCNDLIKTIIDSWSPEQPLDQFLSEDLNNLKDSIDDDKIKQVIDDLKEKIIPLASKESKKGPTRRKLKKNGWLIGLGLVVLIMVGLKFYWLVDVSESIEAPIGVIQGGEALEKLLDYNGLMKTKVRRGGWVKEIMYWPASLTDKETTRAGEFISVSVAAYEYLKKNNLICGANLTTYEDNIFYSDKLNIAKFVSEFLSNINPSDYDQGVGIIVTAFINKYSCK